MASSYVPSSYYSGCIPRSEEPVPILGPSCRLMIQLPCSRFRVSWSRSSLSDYCSRFTCFLSRSMLCHVNVSFYLPAYGTNVMHLALQGLDWVTCSFGSLMAHCSNPRSISFSVSIIEVNGTLASICGIYLLPPKLTRSSFIQD